MVSTDTSKYLSFEIFKRGFTEALRLYRPFNVLIREILITSSGTAIQSKMAKGMFSSFVHSSKVQNCSRAHTTVDLGLQTDDEECLVVGSIISFLFSIALIFINIGESSVP